MRLNDFKLTENFNLMEFQCPCCHTVMLSPNLAAKLQSLRLKWGGPLIINSGYRCDRHNREVGGAERSLHRRGMAADVRVNDKDQPRFCALALEVGFTRALSYGRRGFVHLETGEN
jgi:uncharacterized protein YcbK (DUF882 family)